jgi:hypothetical protein
MTNYIIKKWSKSGLLNGISNKQQNELSELFEYASNFILNNQKDLDTNTYVPLIFPIIRRIFIEIKLTNNIIENIINEVKNKYFEFENEWQFDMRNFEMEFVDSYTINKINELRKK